MPTILITGGAGYIGSHVAKELIRQGYQCVIYDNLQTGHRRAVRDALLIEGDLADQEKMGRTFQSYPIESVIHFAADCLVGESMEDPLKYFRNNVKRMVFSSSAAVYGEAKEIPIPEEHPCHPTNPYGETKWVFERVLRAFREMGKLNYVSLRYFNVAGADPEGDLGEDHSPESHLIPLGIRGALTGIPISIYGTDYDTPDGTCIRDYIHVADLASAHLLALQSLEGGGDSGVYNMGNGNGYSVREVIETIKRVTGKEITTINSKRRPGDLARLVASAEKIRKELGWRPKYSGLDTIVATAWQWHQSHPNGYGDRRIGHSA